MKKACAKCGAEFEYSGKGNRSYCSPCTREYSREWRKRNPASNRASKKKWREAHPEAVREQKRAAYHRRLEQSRESQRKRRAENPEVFAEYTRRRKARARETGRYAYYRHGVTPEQRAALEEAQGGACLLCDRLLSEVPLINIDHDHATRLIRGILCGSCNTRLGWYESRIDRVRRYLGGPHHRPARWDEAATG